jgi:plastocyanin
MEEEASAPDADLTASADVVGDARGDVTADASGKIRFNMPFRKSSDDKADKKSKEPAHKGGSPHVEPTDFWRSGTVRPYRQQQGPKKKQSLWDRITGFYFPAWVPVVAIIVVVFGILGLLFVTRSATGAPRIGQDHWHATYQFFVCGQKQPNAPTWEAGVHTHGDGVVHIHPFNPSEEGAGARLSKWFEYGGGVLKSDEIRMPGSDRTWKNGDTCTTEEGIEEEGTVQLYVTSAGEAERQLTGRDITRYLPHDGDRIRLIFGPEQEIIQETDRTIIPEEEATREIEITVTDDGASGQNADATARFEPARVSVTQGETVKVVIKNTGSISHGLRFAGNDNEYDTQDDYVSQPDIIPPGADGFVVIRLDSEGTFNFRNSSLQEVTGEVVVQGGTAATPSPTPAAVDSDLDVRLADNFFDPATLTAAAGEQFRINMTNEGTFVHNIRFAGPDGEYDTDDDLVSDDIRPGGSGELIGSFEEAGTYPFRCDFHIAQDQTGTLTLE